MSHALARKDTECARLHKLFFFSFSQQQHKMLDKEERGSLSLSVRMMCCIRWFVAIFLSILFGQQQSATKSVRGLTATTREKPKKILLYYRTVEKKYQIGKWYIYKELILLFSYIHCFALLRNLRPKWDWKDALEEFATPSKEKIKSDPKSPLRFYPPQSFQNGDNSLLVFAIISN